MGSYGSGRQRTRPVAEELLALRVRSLRPSLQRINHGWPRAEVALTWRVSPGTTITQTGELRYQHPDALLLQIDAQAQSTAPPCITGDASARRRTTLVADLPGIVRVAGASCFTMPSSGAVGRVRGSLIDHRSRATGACTRITAVFGPLLA